MLNFENMIDLNRILYIININLVIIYDKEHWDILNLYNANDF